MPGIRTGQRARFYPSQPGGSVIAGTITSVDPAPSRQLSRPLLASTFGGDIATVKSERGELVAHEALYRVVMQADQDEKPATWISRGLLRVDADFIALANNFITRPIALLIRESGF